jgi:hypothetical protein
MGATSNPFSVSQAEAKRIRDAENSGGHNAGLRTVLEILREKNEARARERAKIDSQF